MNMNLIRHEWFLNRRGLWIGGGIILFFNAMFAGMAEMYLGNEQMLEVIKSFPQGMLEAFGMHLELMTSFEGWMSGEAYIFFILLLGSYTCIWAASSISRERDQQTGEFLFTLTYSRASIYFSKAAAHLVQITLIFVLSYFIILLFGMLFSDIDSPLTILVVFTGGYLICLAFAGIGYILSVLLSSERAAISAAVGVVLISFLLNMLASLNENINWLAEFSLFSIFNTIDMVTSSSLSMLGVIVTVGIYAAGLMAGFVLLKRQDITT